MPWSTSAPQGIRGPTDDGVSNLPTSSSLLAHMVTLIRACEHCPDPVGLSHTAQSPGENKWGLGSRTKQGHTVITLITSTSTISDIILIARHETRKNSSQVQSYKIPRETSIQITSPNTPECLQIHQCASQIKLLVGGCRCHR